MLVVPRFACPQLALDDVQRHALTRKLERVRVAQLVRGEPAPDPGADAESAELRADGCAQPRAQLFPAPLVHPDLVATAALAVAHQQRPAPMVEVMLGERERLLDAQPG